MSQQTDDEAEFRGFVTARWNALVATAFLVTADRHIAEDCVQEALVGLHRHWKRISGLGNPEGYARKAALNSALSWRRRRRIAEVTLEVLPDVRAQLVADESLDPDLVAALRCLPPRMRAAVALRFVEDRSEAEIAQLLGCSVGTVKSSTHKGLAKLRAALTSAAEHSGSTAKGGVR
jgi:RNA polymerase sigma-70 factor (sigma-E family)